MRGLVATSVTAVLWALWKTRNVACFKNVFPYDLTSVIALTAHWMDSWAVLQIRGRRGLQHRGQDAAACGS
jgi:hypothetical protein